MTELMMKLRRSPRTLLERDGYPGPGPGRLGLAMGRAGAGKTAFLVGIGLDALLSNQQVLHVTLHRTVEKVRSWYDDLLRGLAQQGGVSDKLAQLQLAAERRRHIHTFVGKVFTPNHLSQTLEIIETHMEFHPEVIIVDRVALEETPRSFVEEVKSIAGEAKAELWLTCRVHRDGPAVQPGHLPYPADGIEDLVDLAFRLVHDEGRMRLVVLKDRGEILERGTNLLLDPNSMLLVPGSGLPD